MQPTYSLSVAATKIDPDKPPPVTTLRGWIDQYGEYLSEQAAPEDRPAGHERRLTEQDIAILRLVAALRREGKRRAEIVEQLQGAKPQAGEIIVEESDANAQENRSRSGRAAPLQRFATASQTAQDGLFLPVAIDGLDKRLDALQRHVDRLERNQRDRLVLVMVGVGVGLVAGILLMLAAYLLASI